VRDVDVGSRRGGEPFAEAGEVFSPSRVQLGATLGEDELDGHRARIERAAGYGLKSTVAATDSV